MGACSGFRIIEFGSMVTAPLTGQLLGDFGADVIKIEPIAGEIMRTVPPVYNGQSAAFAQWNRNKSSIALDLRRPEALEIVHKLIDTADAVIVNSRPSVAAAIGIDYDSLAKRNPRLVYASLTGYGPTGPYQDLPAYDMMIQGLTGFAHIQGGDGPPELIRSPVVDKVVAYAAAMSIMAALLYREKGGKGQKIDISMMDVYASFILPETFYTYSFVDAPPAVKWAKDLFNVERLADGWIIGFIMPQSHFEGVCKAFKLEKLLGDPRFADVASRNINQKALMAEIGSACAHMTVAEFIAVAREKELPFAPVNTVEQFMADAQASHNETFVDFEDKTVGRVKLLNSFVRMSETPVNAKALPPHLGENTENILRSIGILPEDIKSLRAEKVIG